MFIRALPRFKLNWSMCYDTLRVTLMHGTRMFYTNATITRELLDDTFLEDGKYLNITADKIATNEFVSLNMQNMMREFSMKYHQAKDSALRSEWLKYKILWDWPWTVLSSVILNVKSSMSMKLP